MNKRSYVTEIENLQILLALEAGELSEGQAAKAMQIDRVSVRDLRLKAISHGVRLWGVVNPPTTPVEKRPPESGEED